LAVFVITFVIEKQGRRRLLLISTIGMVLSSIGVTITFAGLKYGSSATWGPPCVLMLVVYVVTFEIGLGPIPWLYVSEVTPLKLSGSVNSMAQTMNFTCNTIVALSTPALLGGLGIYGFVPFGVSCLIGVIVIFKYVAETKQKTVEEMLIQFDQ